MRLKDLRLLLLISIPLFAATSVVSFIFFETFFIYVTPQQSKTNSITSILLPATPTPAQISYPKAHVIPTRLHVYQTFNNCGPATLSMALSYFGISHTQNELGQIMRPYQIVGGDNDDKSVTLEEVADQAEKYGLHAYLRPNGNMERLKAFIANDIPIVTRTWLKPNEDIGHYRVIRGYDEEKKIIIQDDSLQGKDLMYSYEEFGQMWIPFNYEYLVLVDDAKKDIVEQILGEDLSSETAWLNAQRRIDGEIIKDPSNIHLTFALSRIHYHLKNYEKSVEEFNKVESLLSFRTLWYQIEPILSIYEIGDNMRVLSITERILNNQNRAFTELYLLRGKVYQRLGNEELAMQEFKKALLYNVNNEEAKRLAD